VGIAPHALGGVAGCLVAPFDQERWLAALRPHLEADDPRVPGARQAAAFSADRMAERVLIAYRSLLGEDRSSAAGWAPPEQGPGLAPKTPT
jgi:hypothetical protein